MVPFAAFRVVQIPIVPPRNEYVNCKRIVFPLHFLDRGVHFAYGLAQRRGRILQSMGAHLFL